MFLAREPQEYLQNLVELRSKDAKKRFRRSIFDEYPLKTPDGRPACAYCGGLADTLDHIVPKTEGGFTERSNLIPACRAHNLNKGSSNWKDWFREQHFFCSKREQLILNWISYHSYVQELLVRYI